MIKTLKTSTETFNDSLEEKFKIAELKEKFDIQVSEKELKEYKDTVFSMKEIQKIQEGISSVSELAKAKLEMLKKNYENSEAVKKSQEYLKQTLKSGKEAASKSTESAEKLFDTSMKKLGNTDAGKKTKEIVGKAKEEVKSLGFVSLVEKWKKSDNFFLKLLGSFFGFFTGLLGLSNKAEDLKNKTEEKIKEKLNPEQIQITKNHISKILTETFPTKEEYIKKMLDNPKVLTNEKISFFYNKIKNGETITLNDLTNDFKELEITKLLTEKANNFKKELYISVQKEIELKYNKTLTTDQISDLGKLIGKYLTVNPANIEALQSKIVDEHQIQLKDIMPLFFEGGKNSAGFMFGLISADIVSAKDIAISFVEKGGEIIQISMGVLGLDEYVNIDDLYENVSEMEEKDKAILIGLLYRKGGLFLNIFGSLTSLSSKLLIETILPTNSGVDGIKLGVDSLIHGNTKQIENFTKIEKALGGTKVTEGGSLILKEALENLTHVKKNFAVLELIKSSEGNIDNFYKNISDFESKTKIKLDIGKYNSFEDLQRNISSKMSLNTSHGLGIREINNSLLGFGSNSAIQEFNTKLESIVSNQSRVASGKINFNPFKKLTDAIDVSKVSKLGDSLLFELRSPEDAKSFLKQANELAKKSPKLIKGIFDKLPIIAIAGLAATGEDPFFENLGNELPYLLPIVGPIMMVADAGVDWSTIPPRFMKGKQAVIAGGLLTLDGYFFLSEKGWINKGKYLVKPIKDIIGIGKGTVNIGHDIYKGSRVLLKEGIKFKEIIKNALNKTKALKGKVKALAIIALIGYGAVELAFADNQIPEFDYYTKEGKLDTSKVKKDLEFLTLEEKNDIIKIILNSNSEIAQIEGVDYTYKQGNSLSIVSTNNEVQSDWLINKETKETLFNTFGIDNYTFEYNKEPA